MGSGTRAETELVRTVTGDTFKEAVLDGAGPMVVEFMSYGCAHCRTIEPLVQHAAELLESRERVFRVNVAIDQNLATRYGVRGTPTFVMFLDGREVGRAEGPRPELSSVMDALTQPFTQ